MNRLNSRVAIVLLVNAFIITPLAVSPLLAQDNNPTKLLKAPSEPVTFDVLDLSKTSLRFASADASFFSAGFQTKKQWHAFLQSDFAKHVLNSKIAQKWIATFNDKWEKREGEINQVRGYLDNPNLNSVVNMLGDLFDDEVFVYGDGQFPNTILEINKLVNEMKVVVMAADNDPTQLLEYLKSLDKNRLDQIHVPTVVFGGKISNKDTVIELLSMLEGFVSLALGQPQLARISDGFKHTDDEGGTRLSMTVKSSMIPWESMAQDPRVGEFVDELKRLSEDRAFAITLGMLDEYLVLAISESKDDLPALREVSSPLLDSPNMALIKEKAKLNVLGIGYSSDELAETNFEANLKNYFSNNGGQYMIMLNSTIEDELLDADDDDEEETDSAQKLLDIFESLPEDFTWLDEQIGQHVPKFRGQTGVTVARPDGVETWMQYRTESVLWDSQPKLPVLDHLGGKPLGFIAAKRQYHPEYFETCRLIAQKVHTYLEKASEAEIFDDEKEEEQFNVFLEKGWPLLVKFADVIEQDIIPSTKDGQLAVVLTESNVKAKKFANDMVASKQDLPLPEFAKIVGTNDSTKLIDGFEKLYGLVDEAAGVAHEIDPSVPEGFTAQRPESRSNPAGQNFFYALPKEAGIPESILPQALIAKDFAYFSYSNPQLAALIKPAPLNVTSSFFKEHKAIGAAMYVDVGRIFEQFKPWALYGIDQEGDNVVVPAQNGFSEVTKSDLMELYDAFTKIGEFVSVEAGSESGSIAHARHFR